MGEHERDRKRYRESEMERARGRNWHKKLGREREINLKHFWPLKVP